MGHHLVLNVIRPIKRSEEMVATSSSDAAAFVVDEENRASYDEEKPLLPLAECRICQEEDSFDALETPCACNGSLKYAHRKCVQHWCDEKGDITCEICHQPYQPGYVVPSTQQCLEETTIDIGGGWQMSEADRQFLEAEYGAAYNATSASGAAFCRSAILILMALLLLRHASFLPASNRGGGDGDASAFLTLFLLRIAGFLLPCYIMIWAISILQRRRQRQEALAAAHFAFVLQAGERRGLHVTVASLGPAPARDENV